DVTNPRQPHESSGLCEVTSGTTPSPGSGPVGAPRNTVARLSPAELSTIMLTFGPTQDSSCRSQAFVTPLPYAPRSGGMRSIVSWPRARALSGRRRLCSPGARGARGNVTAERDAPQNVPDGQGRQPGGLAIAIVVGVHL